MIVRSIIAAGAGMVLLGAGFARLLLKLRRIGTPADPQSTGRLRPLPSARLADREVVRTSGGPLHNTNARQTIVLGPEIIGVFHGSSCPPRLRLAVGWKLGISDARGKWVTVNWVKVNAYGRHRSAVTDVSLFGDGGGVSGYTLHGPAFRKNSGAYKRVRDWPRNGVQVKWIDAKDDFVILDMTVLYARNHQGAHYGCKQNNVNTNLNILR